MDFDLSEDQRIALDALRRFAEAEVAPAVEPWRDAPIPKALARGLLRKLSRYGVGSGWLGESDGGLALDLVTSGLLYEELARISPGLAGTAFINEGVSLAIATLGTPEQKRRWLPALLAGDSIGCSAITEPGVGSNVRDVRTRAVRDGDGWRVRGEKTWISNAGISDLAVVVVRGEDESQGLSQIVVEREDGYRSRELAKLGLNDWSTAELVFDDVFVPGDRLLGEPGGGLRRTLQLFERARCFVAAIANGIARAALDAAVAYVQTREQWGKKIGGHQLVQELIADMATELDAARLLMLRGLHLVQKGIRCDTQTSMAKYFATEAAVRIASRAIEVHGAYGLSRELSIELHFRNARMMTIPDGTSEIQKLVIGRNLIGLAAF
ncbi:MAG: acyl-CoA/acyl-ACP dehydrogenase [Deltaproteobacteria bacterium]|nr:acyl-CoA/acyl-ACP dehydrogenase [Deltaproteobacteria bacterium]